MMGNAISACLIVKDEEKHLENCLNSIKSLADEIIIVDTGSKDKTKEIAKKFTNNIFDFRWNNDFSEARNFALSKSTKDWILSIDADESFSKNDCIRIKELLLTHPEIDAFFFNWRTYTNDMGIMGWQSVKDDKYEESKCASGFYSANLLRLWKNNKGYFFEGRIHETPHNSIKTKNGRALQTDIVIHHFGALDKKKLFNKTEDYVDALKERLEERDFIEKSEDFICFELGRELLGLDKLDEAISYFEKAIGLKSEFKYLSILGELYLEKDWLDKSERILIKANELNPNDVSVITNLGTLYAKRKEFNRAIRKFEKAIAINPNSAVPYFNLGLAYLEQGKKNKATVYFNKATELNPNCKSEVDRFI